MIKLEITLKEKRNIKLNSGNATDIEVTLKEIGIHATNEEKEVLQIMKNKLNYKEKVQIINKDKTKTDKEILTELLIAIL